MRYAILNFALGAALAFQAWILPAFKLPLLWMGLSFCTLGIAYLLRRPSLLGKRPDGSIALGSWILLLPLHLFIHGVWHLVRIFSRENPTDAVSHRLLVGRRLLPHEVPAEVELIVDLTAEFPECKEVRRNRDYRLFPVLDASIPQASQLRRFIASLPDAVICIHCAQGHGRTGLFAAAFLIEKGICANAGDALALLAEKRPGIVLNKVQRDFISAHYP